jgi:hypothetical protein
MSKFNCEIAMLQLKSTNHTKIEFMKQSVSQIPSDQNAWAKNLPA